MADDSGRYWDFEQCGWVPCPGVERVPVPEQATAALSEADEVVVAPV